MRISSHDYSFLARGGTKRDSGKTHKCLAFKNKPSQADTRMGVLDLLPESTHPAKAEGISFSEITPSLQRKEKAGFSSAACRKDNETISALGLKYLDTTEKRVFCVKPPSPMATTQTYHEQRKSNNGAGEDEEKGRKRSPCTDAHLVPGQPLPDSFIQLGVPRAVADQQVGVDVFGISGVVSHA